MRSKHCAVLVVLLSVSATSVAFAGAGLTPLGDLPGGPVESYASGVSGDGSVVVGRSSHSFSGEQAFRWTSGGGMVGLGDLPGAGFVSRAYGVSADGSIIVGWGASASGQEAFRWTSAGGMVGLGYPPGEPLVEPFSTATGVSGDGSVVVGVGSFDYRYSDEAFRWTSSSGMGGLGYLPAPFFGRAAYGVSRDGSVVVGVIESESGYEALRWTSEGGMVGLGTLPGKIYGAARGVSGDGAVVVGQSADNVGYNEAFRWTSGGGMERLWDVLVDRGVDPAADGWTKLAYASGISADGRTIVGTGVRFGHDEAFAAFIPIALDLPGDFNFDGNVDAADYVVWRKTDGTPDGYNTLRSNFGRTSGSGLAARENPVPEPGGLALLTLAVPALLRRRFYRL